MILIRKLFAVGLAWVFLTAKIVHSSETNGGIDLTEGIKNSSIFVEKSTGDDILSPNTTSFGEMAGLSFPCDSKTCLSLCCSPGKALLDRSCVEDNATSWTWLGIKSLVENDDFEKNKAEHDFHLLIDDPCAINWMTSSVTKNFNVLPNGSIYALDFDGGTLFDLDYHCLFRKPESEVYLARVCHPWIVKVDWQIICTTFSSLVMLAILIAYSVVPELKNLHGMVFRAYMVTYIGTHISLMGQQLTVGTRSFPGLFTFFVFSLHYTAGCCALWLNVMSFNIWRTFRSLRSFESNTKENDRKKFILYAIYAFVTPGVLNISALFIMCYVPYFRQFSLSKNLILWTCAGLLTSVIICNGLLHASTALRIRKYQKDTKHLANGVNKHHEVEKQWFNLHVKLFMVTGTHTIMWVIWELWPIPINTCIMIVLEVMQSVLIFIIFVWKDNVKRSLRKRFDDTLCRLQSTFGTSHANSTTKI